jgi:hypothetical protein
LLQLNRKKTAICPTFHNNYEQISNTLISIHDPLYQKRTGEKNGKKFTKENNSKRRNPVLHACIGEKK